MTIDLPNLRHLHAVAEVTRRGSVSAAARAIPLTQPAVTQAVAGLERRLACELFERRPSGLQPTAAGRAFAQRLERALALLRAALAQASDVRVHPVRAVPKDALRGVTSAQLAALVAVVEEGALARAARRAGRARPTYHRALRALERVAGIALLERTSFGLRPTREAERIAVAAQLAAAELEQARTELAVSAGTAGGQIVIGSMPLARSALLPDAVLEFAAEHPRHGVSILDGPYEMLLAALRRGGADVLVGAMRDPPPGDDVEQEHLFDDPLALIVRAGHPLTRQPTVTLRELGRFAWVSPRAGSPLHHHFDELLAALPQRAVLAPVECNSLVAARALLRGSDRVMLLSAQQVRLEREAGQLVALPHPLGRTVRAIGLTLRRGWRPTAQQAVFVDILRRRAISLGEEAERLARPPRSRRAQSALAGAPSPLRNSRGVRPVRRVKKRVK